MKGSSDTQCKTSRVIRFPDVMHHASGERYIAANGHIPMTIAPGTEKPISSYVIRFSQAIGACVRKTFPIRCFKWSDIGREYIERYFVLGFIDQAMNRFVEHQLLSRVTVTDTSKTRVSLSKEESRSTVWSCSEKYMFDLGRSCRRPQRMHIINCWNSSPSLPQRVVSHSLGMRNAIRCWVDNQATQKALVGDLSRKPARREVQTVSQCHVRSPQKEIQLQAKLDEALERIERIEEQTRNHQTLALKVEQMRKLIQDMTWAQQGPPHDP
ncbi:NBS-LRR type resistance protein [Cucumis melo var. makuwa]|uniref:NBS-LRR type resistance protein n=1 Tax=Cucumis melo var. makuwa TaxID=1194695 RepID=A0A5A7T3U3_CUCMM|nr:NBS-LRR type resistance protein [Cucumis melo var. makuwa]TYK22789.1 NBS-LRR type resistance protein [Cucumis melo var. makuwa]